MPSPSSIYALFDQLRALVPSGAWLEEVAAPLAVLLAWRWVDGQEAEREAIAAFNGEDYSRVLPDHLRWSKRFSQNRGNLESEAVGPAQPLDLGQLPWLAEALKANPQVAQSTRRAQWKKASDALSRLAGADPTNFLYSAALGDLLYFRGRYFQGREQYRRAHDLLPTDSPDRAKLCVQVDRLGILVESGEAIGPDRQAVQDELEEMASAKSNFEVGPEDVVAIFSAVGRLLDLPSSSRTLHRSGFRDWRVTSLLADWVAALPFDTPSEQRAAGATFDAILAQSAGRTRYLSDLATPPAVSYLMAALANPLPGERVYDPCFGTGALLSAAAEAIWERGRDVSAKEWNRARKVPLFGVEKNESLYPVAFTRLLLSGVRPALELGDTLEREAAGDRKEQGFDCVLADPPWGMRVNDLRFNDFPVKSRNAESLFIQHAVRSTRHGGRAVVAVPQGVLFRGGADMELRQWLTEEFGLDSVIRIPASALKGSRPIPMALLVIKRGPPSAHVRIVDLRSLPESASDARRLVRYIHQEDKSEVFGRRPVPIDELRDNEYRLDLVIAQKSAQTDDLASLKQFTPTLPLRQVATVISGATINRNALTESSRYGAAFVIRTTEVTPTGLALGGRYLLNSFRETTRPEQVIRPGDILLSVDGTIGKSLLVREAMLRQGTDSASEPPRPVIAQKGIAIIRVLGNMDPRFLAAMFASRVIKEMMSQAAHGTSIRHLAIKDLERLPVPCPPLGVQERVTRLLADHDGDALDVLLSVLNGEKADPLSTLVRDHPAFQRLTANGDPEPSELAALVQEVFQALRPLRNDAAHGIGPDQIPSDLLPWLLMVGSVPISLSLRGRSAREEKYSYENLTAAQVMLQHAEERVSKADGPMARQLERLTQRLTTWVSLARESAAADFSFFFHQTDDELDHEGEGIVVLKAELTGSVPVSDVVFTTDLPSTPVSVERLGTGEFVLLRVRVARKDAFEDGPNNLVYSCTVAWQAKQPDGVVREGTQEVPILLFRVAEEVENDPKPELGVSPYIAGDPVVSLDMFYGRQEVLDDIRAHIGGGTRVILLEGNRRTGKTSILEQLRQPERGLLDQWILVYCSFQGTVGHKTKDGIPTDGVFKLLVRDIGLACAAAGKPVPLPEMEPVADSNIFRLRLARAIPAFFEGIDPYEALQIYVDMVVDAIAPKRLLLMVDEFDKLQVGIDNGVTSPQVPENIRNLLQSRPRIAAILSGSRRLKRLREEYWSALFGFGHRIGIDPLSADEARSLVSRPLEGRITFDAAAVNMVIEATACQPYLIQSLCARIFEMAKLADRRRIATMHVEEAIDRMVQDNEHFQALWSYAGTERRRYLLWLCHRLGSVRANADLERRHHAMSGLWLDGGTVRVNADLLCHELEKAGLHATIEEIDEDIKFMLELELVALVNTPVGPQYNIAIPLMRRWMERNIDADAQRRRAVDESKGEIL